MQWQAVDLEQIDPVLNQRILNPSDYNGDATLQRTSRRNTFELLKKIKEVQKIAAIVLPSITFVRKPENLRLKKFVTYSHRAFLNS